MRLARCDRAASLLLACALFACRDGGAGGGSGAAAPSPAPAPSISLAGTLRAAPGSAVDGDVNDPAAALAPNDTLADVQRVPNPVLLGGYANQPGAGPEGRSRASGDARDLYLVSLAAGDRIELEIAEPAPENDLDLALLTLAGAPVAVAAEAGGNELLVAPAAGEQILEVSAFAGASRYLLSISPGNGTAQAQPEFVPGELILRMRDETSSGPAATAGVPAFGMTWAAGAPGEAQLMRCRSRADRDLAFRRLGLSHLIESDPEMTAASLGAQLMRDTPRMAKALRRRADVRSADLNYIRRPSAVPQDALYPLQWHYPQIRLPEAWDLAAPASGVVVAVVDTGVASAHPELLGQLVPGFDFVSNRTSAADGDGCDANPEDPGDGIARGTSSWHGTHVAGTVAARTSLAPGAGAAGVAGVAWNARVMPLRALGRAGGTDFDVMQALRYAAGLPNECGGLPQQRADVANLSLGGPGRSDAFQALIPELRARGLVLVAAAGNEASDTPSYPAAYDGVISVAAVDIRGQLARYSNFGPTIDVAAPGGDLATDVNADGYADGVLSLMIDDTTPQPSSIFQFAAGTSMAAPHVAGVVALMRGVNRALTPDQIDALLGSGRMARDLGSPAQFGAGLVDARAAVEAARDAIAAPPVPEARLAVAPVLVRLGALARESILTAANSGAAGAPLRVNAVRSATDDGAPWLSVAAIDADANGLGRYRVSVDRSALAPGPYRGRVIFDSDRNDLEVPVLIDVAAAPAAAPDAGRHWVLLIDAASRQTRRAVEVAPARGSYAFRFEGVAAGAYQLLAGSDLDHDGSVCESGEACGAHPSLATPQTLRVEVARTGLDFETAFRARSELAGASRAPQPVALGAAPR